MGLRDLNNIKIEYRTRVEDVVSSFFIPCLSEAYEYKRAVGYFSSTVLLSMSVGLGAIAKKGGRIKLLVSPRLSKEDYEAIEHGYQLRELAEKRLTEAFDEDVDFFQKEERFSLLAHLIENRILDIKVAVPEGYNEMALFHEKLGIIVDDNDDVVSFSGSNNETYAALYDNYECFDVFCSWKSEESRYRCREKSARFDRMWLGREEKLITIKFPDVIKDKLMSYKKDNIDYMQLDSQFAVKYAKKAKLDIPRIPESVSLYDYQTEAIHNWVARGYRGIFDMATGTGKTFTALGAICELAANEERLVAVICCPFKHLVEQWAEEVKIFGINPVICHGESKYKDKLKRKEWRIKRKADHFLCVITTNGTFMTKYFQETIRMNLDRTLLVVDEAHNFGAPKISGFMKENYPYRLALSATLERFRDPKGTQRLYEFFGEKCIEYTLDRAIQEQKLTKYKYYPVMVTLTDDELDKYYAVSEKIKKFIYQDDDEMPEALKKLLIKRARIIAGAKNKISALKEVIQPYKDKNNLLVYCGAITYEEYGYQNYDDIKQIDTVCKMLMNDYGMSVRKFTSEENNEDRKRLIRMYKDENIQALVAIKCLDEGMNIPSIKTAFILASSTNPKEYIQRRGRVLRRAEGKEYAEIYDFITVPRPLNEVKRVDESLKRIEIGLVGREFNRLIDFANLSLNPSYSNELIDEIKDAYDMDAYDIGDDIL